MKSIIILLFMVLDPDGKMHTSTQEYMSNSTCHFEAQKLRTKILKYGQYVVNYTCVDSMMTGKQT